MAEIRSSIEIALERANKISEITNEEKLNMKYEEEGKKIAVKFFNETDIHFKELLKNIDPAGLKIYIDGIMDILLRNIILPKEKEQWDAINRAMEGIAELKGSSAQNVMMQLRQFLSSYEETKNGYYEQLKMQFEAKLPGIQEMVAQQYGQSMSSKMTIEAIPQFQQEWTKLSTEINNQFIQKINQIKEYLKNLP
jgi:hypothetical protein